MRVEKVLAMRWAQSPAPPGAPRQPLCGRPAEFLVKYNSRAHIHCDWLTEEAALELAAIKVKNVVALHGRQPFDNSDARNWQPQRVVAHRCQGGGNGEEYLVKWDGIGTGLGYEHATWEAVHEPGHPLGGSRTLPALIRAMQQREYEAVERAREGRARERMHVPCPVLATQPDWLPGGPAPEEGAPSPALFQHQLEALNFLRAAYCEQHGVILADDMGLGKTISALAYLRALGAEFGAVQPSLVVAPLSTLPNWAAEAQVWVPNCNVVVLHGPPAARELITAHELWQHTGGQGRARARGALVPKAEIVLTSYETVTHEALFRSVAWEALVLDEGHKLKKGPKAATFGALAGLRCRHKVLLTGTPVQNTLEELFNLLHFLNPTTFPSFDAFTALVDDTAAAATATASPGSSDAGITPAARKDALLAVAAPHMLRRLKLDVLTRLPPRREVHVPVDLSAEQTFWYRALLMNNRAVLAGRDGPRASHASQLKNVVTQLRKVCNHPCLVDGHDLAWFAGGGAEAAPGSGSPSSGGAVNASSSGEEDASTGGGSASDRHKLLVASCGKLALLDVMLPALRQRGHRVLLFSQMVKTLDVLEVYMRSRFGAEGYERVDGTMPGPMRQAAIGRFNAPGSSRFVFLLSTRACGLGINLATADTVIIYDSDWNPHQDLQAMSRAHRYGQTRPVAVFRLFTRYTVEERILAFAKRKMALDNIFKGPQRRAEALLQDVLRWGTDRLFAEDGDEDQDLAQALPDSRLQQQPGSATADLLARYGQMDAAAAGQGAGDRPVRRMRYSAADVGVLLDNARATLCDDPTASQQEAGIPSVAPPPPVAAAPPAFPQDGLGLGRGASMLDFPRLGDDDDGMDFGMLGPATSLQWDVADLGGSPFLGTLSPGPTPDFEDTLFGSAAPLGDSDCEMQLFLGDTLLDAGDPPSSGATAAGPSQQDGSALEEDDDGRIDMNYWDRMLPPMVEGAEPGEPAEPAEFHATGVGGRVKMRSRKRPTEQYVMSMHQQAEAELDAQRCQRRFMDTPPAQLGFDGAAAGGSPASPVEATPSRAAAVAAPEWAQVSSLLRVLRLPESLSSVVQHLGLYLMSTEPGAQLAAPTLLALTLLAADATGTPMAAELRSPRMLGHLFGLLPEAVEAYCAAVSARVHPYLAYVAQQQEQLQRHEAMRLALAARD